MILTRVTKRWCYVSIYLSIRIVKIAGYRGRSMAVSPLLYGIGRRCVGSTGVKDVRQETYATLINADMPTGRP
jgi:hypothetical protein